MVSKRRQRAADLAREQQEAREAHRRAWGLDASGQFVSRDGWTYLRDEEEMRAVWGTWVAGDETRTQWPLLWVEWKDAWYPVRVTRATWGCVYEWPTEAHTQAWHVALMRNHLKWVERKSLERVSAEQAAWEAKQNARGAVSLVEGASGALSEVRCGAGAVTLAVPLAVSEDEPPAPGRGTGE